MEEQANESILSGLPQAFTEFLEANDISLEYFNEVKDFPRYIRLKLDANISLQTLKKDLNTTDALQINYINGLYSIPGNIKIVNSALYQSGVLYGIDLSSAAVVKALDPQQGERVLDLCCCPGMKLCYIADLIGSTGKVVGVDINETRLQTCKSIVKKYKLEKVIELQKADGTIYNHEILFDRVLVDAECTHDGSLKHLQKFIEKYKGNQQSDQNEYGKSITKKIKISENEEKEISQKSQANQETINEKNKSSSQKIESHGEEKNEKQEEKEDDNDNDIEERRKEKRKQIENQLQKNPKISKREAKRRAKQMEKNNSNVYTQVKEGRNNWTEFDFNERVLDPVKLANIINLQKNLLTNGFKQCKVGGIIIYSTCSFARAQNEDIVSWFLQENINKVEQIEVFQEDSATIPFKEGLIPMTVRFDPLISKSGGMFVSKFRKL